jgi:hypothetical protein
MSSGGYRHFLGRAMARLVALMAVTTVACGLLAVAAQAAGRTIENVSATQISSKRAVLNATIDPNGLETTYEFWIEYAVCQKTPPGDARCESISVEKVGEGHIAAGSTPETVVAAYSHLSPEYEYEYWVVAKNAAGETQSSSHKFTALPAPVVESESTSSVSASDATLEAQIDPEGQAVYYQFQVVANPDEYASEIECSPQQGPLSCGIASIPGALKIGYLPAGSEAKTVSFDLAHAGMTLASRTTYHYRVLVAPAVQTEDTTEWAGPPVDGLDRTFTTSTAGPAPKIESVSLANLTSADATLGAQIDTEGLETTYEFKLWSAPCFSRTQACDVIQVLPLPSGKLLGSFLSQTVSLDLASADAHLIPGGEYEYSLEATSAGGTSESAPQMFTVPQETAVPLKSTASTVAGSGPGPGSQTSGPSLSPPPVGDALADFTPTRKTAAKGQAKVKRSVDRKKRKRHKAKANEHGRHKARKA